MFIGEFQIITPLVWSHPRLVLLVTVGGDHESNWPLISGKMLNFQWITVGVLEPLLLTNPPAYRKPFSLGSVLKIPPSDWVLPNS